MPNINLELQLKFLNELDEALKDALARYGDDGPDKLAELKYMQREVIRARRIISERVASEAARGEPRRAPRQDDYREAAFT